MCTLVQQHFSTVVHSMVIVCGGYYESICRGLNLVSGTWLDLPHMIKERSGFGLVTLWQHVVGGAATVELEIFDSLSGT